MFAGLPLGPLTRALPFPPTYKGSGRTGARCLGPWRLGLVPKVISATGGVHGVTKGVSVVESARVFVTRVVELKGAGLSAKRVFLPFHVFSQGHVTHLLA